MLVAAGTLITIEGLDGAGKTTLANALAREIASRGHAVAVPRARAGRARRGRRPSRPARARGRRVLRGHRRRLRAARPSGAAAHTLDRRLPGPGRSSARCDRRDRGSRGGELGGTPWLAALLWRPRLG